MKFDGHLDRESYAIVDELKIRKKLEARTEWRYEFVKETQYGYDLELYRWPKNANKPRDRELFGYIELERADNTKKKSWVTGPVPTYPEWYFYSFLKRKVYQFDYHSREWGELKPEHRNAIYLKFNHELDNCFAVPISAIVRDGDPTGKSKDTDPKNAFLKLPLNHDDVAKGIDESVDLIDVYLSSSSVDQTGLGEFTSA